MKQVLANHQTATFSILSSTDIFFPQSLGIVHQLLIHHPILHRKLRVFILRRLPWYFSIFMSSGYINGGFIFLKYRWTKQCDHALWLGPEEEGDSLVLFSDTSVLSEISERDVVMAQLCFLNTYNWVELWVTFSKTCTLCSHSPWDDLISIGGMYSLP